MPEMLNEDNECMSDDEEGISHVHFSTLRFSFLVFYPFDSSLILTSASPVGQANCCVVLLIPSCTPLPCWTLTCLWFCLRNESQELSLSLKLLTLNSDFFECASKAPLAMAAVCVTCVPRKESHGTFRIFLCIFPVLLLFDSCCQPLPFDSYLAVLRYHKISMHLYSGPWVYPSVYKVFTLSEVTLLS